MTAKKITHQPQRTSKNMQYLKNSNRGAVLRSLALKKASNRTELASQLNLTKMAISNIVNDLIDDNILLEVNPDIGGTNGRPAKHLLITDWSLISICIYIRRYAISGMLMDINGNTAYPSTYPIPENTDNEAFLSIVEHAIQTLLPKAPPKALLGIGISTIGPADIYQKKILNPPNFRNIRNAEIGKYLNERFNIPVYMDNDMNCSALAEHFFGNGRSHRDLVFLGFSSGVGAGIIMNEKIIHGFAGFAGELGHISINPYGPFCPCGQKGCIELYTSGQNILKNTRMKDFEELNTVLSSETPPEFIQNCISEYLQAMRTLIVLVANSYDPDIIILGDIDGLFIQKYIPDLEEYVNTHMLSHGYTHIRILPSALGESSSLHGAGCIVFQHVFNGELFL